MKKSFRKLGSEILKSVLADARIVLAMFLGRLGRLLFSSGSAGVFVK